MNIAVPPQASAAIGRRVRVMIVDDAVVVRGLFSRWVQAERDLEVVASLRTGREAVSQVERADPDVVVLDVDMPELDGIAALPLLLQKKPDLVVIMASTLTRRNAEISLRALSLGAADYIPKPDNNREVTGSVSFRRDLIEKIRQLGLRSKRLRVAGARAGTPVGEAPAALPPTLRAAGEDIALRAMPAIPPRVLLIGSSTGGPQALNSLVTQIGGVLDRAPVLITQHMPPTFTTILAEHLARLASRPVREAVEGEEVNAGTIYLAPGGKHMSVKRRDGTAVITLDDGPLINFCKPAVDPLFSSAAEVWGQKVLALVLTGMGSDGLRGSQAIAAAGGSILAQDEATSVVWGMPGQVAHAGLASAVLPLNEIAGKLTQLFTGEKA
ncbi:MAG: protein-glutamate methylesterase/protein-glutamine glutaminase [Pseudolabrys sp.]